MPAVNDVGEPGAREPHARFDGRELETERLVRVTEVGQPDGKPRASRLLDLPPKPRHRASSRPYTPLSASRVMSAADRGPSASAALTGESLPDRSARGVLDRAVGDPRRRVAVGSVWAWPLMCIVLVIRCVRSRLRGARRRCEARPLTEGFGSRGLRPADLRLVVVVLGCLGIAEVPDRAGARSGSRSCRPRDHTAVAVPGAADRLVSGS